MINIGNTNGRLRMLFLGLAFTSFTVMPANAAEFLMKLSTPTINDLQHEWMEAFKADLEERSDGRIEVQLYPANQLGPVGSVIEGMQLGSIEANITPAEFYVGVDPRFQATSVPGLFESMEDARAKLDVDAARDALLGLGVDQGIRGIAAVVYGPLVLATRNPVTELADLSGQRIRVLSSETEINSINALGASAVPMPLNEVPAALQQRVIDGASSNLDVFVSLRAYETAPNIVRTNLWYTIALATVSEAWFSSLPDDLQEAVLVSAREMETQLFERQLERVEESETRWQEGGGQLVLLSEEEQATAEEAAAEVAQSFLENNPAVAEIHDLIMNGE